MKRGPFVGAILLALGCVAAARADDTIKSAPNMPTSPIPDTGLGSDLLAVLVSDTPFGPNMEDANIAARFYCSTRGKLTTFVGKEHPPEMNTQVFQQWAVMTYRCVAATTTSTTPPANGAKQ